MSAKQAIPRAIGRKPANARLGYTAERMNKTEAKYALLLEARKQAGEICFWRYEQIKFRLADKTWYTPDFYIMLADGTIEIHETKGFMQDDANVKIKTVAELFPELLFVLVKWEKGGWTFKKYRRGEFDDERA